MTHRQQEQATKTKARCPKRGTQKRKDEDETPSEVSMVVSSEARRAKSDDLPIRAQAEPDRKPKPTQARLWPIRYRRPTPREGLITNDHTELRGQ